MEQQRVYPVAAEPTPKATAPLMPRDGATSEKWDAEQGRELPPQMARTLPLQFMPPPRRSRRSCYRCFCWSLCLLVTLLVLLAATAGILYLVFDPKAPNYSVKQLKITDLQLDEANLNVAASFQVTVTATNPNKAIGIYYVGGSHLRASYEDIQLCEGKLPVFYQGHRNTTTFDVVLSGNVKVDESALKALEKAQSTDEVPLVFRGKVPVKIKFGALKLWKVKFLVTCDIVASDFKVGNSIRLKSTHCRFKFRF